jgi:hypothetical protein
MTQINIDEKINDWINEIPMEEHDKTCNYYMKLGYLIANCSKTIIDPNSSMFDKLRGNIDKTMVGIESRISDNLINVKTSIDKLTESGNKSVLKGGMGERLIERIVKYNFPDYTIVNTSKETGSGDYMLNLPSGDAILFEIKNYKSPIPKKEIDKFKRDLTKTGHKIGIFISLYSGIVGKKRFYIENYNEKQKIIYIPCAGIDGISITWSILLAKECLKLQMPPMSINRGKICELYDNFEGIYKNFCQLRYIISESKEVIEKQLSKLHQKTMELDIDIYKTLKHCSNIIQNELHFSNTLLQNIDYEECNSIIEGLNRKKDKRALSYRYLLDLCKEKKLNIKIPDKNVLIWSCFDDRHIEIIKCKVTKTRVEYIIEDGNININGNKKGLEYLRKFI